MRVCHDLETQRHWRTYLTGNRDKISSKISSGRVFVLQTSGFSIDEADAQILLVFAVQSKCQSKQFAKQAKEPKQTMKKPRESSDENKGRSGGLQGVDRLGFNCRQLSLRCWEVGTFNLVRIWSSGGCSDQGGLGFDVKVDFGRGVGSSILVETMNKAKGGTDYTQ